MFGWSVDMIVLGCLSACYTGQLCLTGGSRDGDILDKNLKMNQGCTSELDIEPENTSKKTNLVSEHEK